MVKTDLTKHDTAEKTFLRTAFTLIELLGFIAQYCRNLKSAAVFASAKTCPLFLKEKGSASHVDPKLFFGMTEEDFENTILWYNSSYVSRNIWWSH